MRRQACRLLLVRVLVEALARLPQLVHVLIHVILVTIVPRAADEIVLLAVVMCLVVRRRAAIRLLLILLLAVYLCEGHAIYSGWKIMV